MACWFVEATLGTDQVLVSIGASANDVNRHNLSLASGSNTVVAFTAGSGSNGSAFTTASIAANTWLHAAAVFTSATARAAYLGGGNKGVNATNLTPAGLDQVRVGVRSGATPGTGYLDGLVAEAAIWSDALTDADIAALASRAVTPRDVRRDALVGYWPLFGQSAPEPDFTVGGRALTLVAGPTRGDHPPVATGWTRAGALFLPPAAAPGRYRPVGPGLIGSPLVPGGLVA
jgi:hypothetical protein